MIKVLTPAILMFAVSTAYAGPDCTKEDQSSWLDKDEFQMNLKEQGYKINVFKITDGNCYEIYGWNKEGKKVEIYYHPVTGKVMKKDVQN